MFPPVSLAIICGLFKPEPTTVASWPGTTGVPKSEASTASVRLTLCPTAVWLAGLDRLDSVWTSGPAAPADPAPTSTNGRETAVPTASVAAKTEQTRTTNERDRDNPGHRGDDRFFDDFITGHNVGGRALYLRRTATQWPNLIVPGTPAGVGLISGPIAGARKETLVPC